jgi:phage FluMu protein Com
MNKLNCDGCYGQKTVVGMGSMRVECPRCLGLGYLIIKDEEPKQSIAEVTPSDETKEVKKRGRPAKTKESEPEAQ